MPAVRRVMNRRGAAAGSSSGSSSFATVSNSYGTPGSTRRGIPSKVATKQSAVPTGLGTTRAEAGKRVWRRLLSGIGRPKRANLARSRSSEPSSALSSSPSRSATASRVMSSSVGPRPPLTTTSAAPLAARRSAATMLARSSATSVTLTSRWPARLSQPPSQNPFPSRVRPSRSSSPMQTMLTIAIAASCRERLHLGDCVLRRPPPSVRRHSVAVVLRNGPSSLDPRPRCGYLSARFTGPSTHHGRVRVVSQGVPHGIGQGRQGRNYRAHSGKV